jgi:bacterial/archaeal transporter family protein
MPWYVYALISAFFAGLVAVFGKLGLKNIDSTVATTVRAVVMAVFLIFVIFSLGKSSLVSQIDSKAMLFIVLSGIAGALSWIFYFHALKVGNVAGVQTVDRISILFSVILAAIFLGEALTIKSVIAILLVLAGGVLMIL